MIKYKEEKERERIFTNMLARTYMERIYVTFKERIRALNGIKM